MTEYIKHENHYNKWLNIFRKLCDEEYRERSFKKKELILKVKDHMHRIMWRMLCYKWFGEDAKSSNLYPQTLKGFWFGKSYNLKEQWKQ